MPRRFKHNQFDRSSMDDREQNTIHIDRQTCEDALQDMKPAKTLYVTKASTTKNKGVTIEIKEAIGKDLKNANVKIIKSHEHAVEEYYFCLSKLRDYFCELCDIPDEWSYGLTIEGVKFDYQGTQMIMGAEITATKYLKHSTGIMTLVSPFKPSKSDKKKNNIERTLPEGCVGILERLLVVAEGYVNGERAAITLAEQEPTPGAVVSTHPHADRPVNLSSVSVAHDGRISDEN